MRDAREDLRLFKEIYPPTGHDMLNHHNITREVTHLECVHPFAILVNVVHQMHIACDGCLVSGIDSVNHSSRVWFVSGGVGGWVLCFLLSLGGVVTDRPPLVNSENSISPPRPAWLPPPCLTKRSLPPHESRHNQISRNPRTTMSSVGIPIKLLYEAEGMKVTVEVSVRRLTNRIEYRAMLAHTSFA